MDNLITLYKQRLNLQNATFTRIDHDDAMVAVVYKIVQRNDLPLILKICPRTEDYLREVFFLKHFAGTLPVPRIIQEVPPEAGIDGAILMEYLPGTLLNLTDFTDALAYEIGSLLAYIHHNRVTGYGDLTKPQDLSTDPHVHFTHKFEEGFAECSNHLPKSLLEQCRSYYDSHINLLASVDGPCIIHRDFRPGNMIIYDGKFQGIIDWASGRASFAEEDFCPIEHGEWPMHGTCKMSFLAGYASIRPVPDFQVIMPLLRLSRAFATIGFMVKHGIWESSNTRLYHSNRRFLETFFK
jgi:aminoglycoside phosphotransferase (APT) family kinase protein